MSCVRAPERRGPLADPQPQHPGPRGRREGARAAECHAERGMSLDRPPDGRRRRLGRGRRRRAEEPERQVQSLLLHPADATRLARRPHAPQDVGHGVDRGTRERDRHEQSPRRRLLAISPIAGQ